MSLNFRLADQVLRNYLAGLSKVPMLGMDQISATEVDCNNVPCIEIRIHQHSNDKEGVPAFVLTPAAAEQLRDGLDSYLGTK